MSNELIILFHVEDYSFVTAVFTKLGSLLSGTGRHCSVLGAPDISGHDHFGTRHFGHIKFGT